MQMASTKNLTAIYIYSNNDELKTMLQDLKLSSKMSYCKMLRQMIWDLSASDRLRQRVQSYFVKHGAKWVASGKQPNHIRIRQDNQTIALASVLAFQICGTGNLSEFTRLLFRFYHAHPAEMKLLKGSPLIGREERGKGRDPKPPIEQAKAFEVREAIQSEAKKRYKEEKAARAASTYRLDVDTVALMTEMVKKMQLKPNALLDFLIQCYMADQDRFAQLQKSPYLWDARSDSENKYVIKKFNLSVGVNKLLITMSFNALGSSNKSAIIRALVRNEAKLREIEVAG